MLDKLTVGRSCRRPWSTLRHRILARSILHVMDDADAFAKRYQREVEDVLIFLTRRTWHGEVALELTAETGRHALEPIPP